MGMVAMKCPSCGADIELDDSREFGFCNFCGTKVMQDKIVVEHSGSVVLDDSKELEKLYKAARNARETSDDATALKHYETISAKDPDSWEALFYMVILRISNIKNAQIQSAAISISNSLPKVFSLINELNDEEKVSAVNEVVKECYITTSWLTNASHSFYKSVTKGNGMMALTGVGGLISSASSTGNALTEDANRCFSIANVMILCGNYIESTFDMNVEDYKKAAVFCWKKGLEFNSDYKSVHNSNLFNNETLHRFSAKINKYDPTYQVVEEKSGGCYVATAVYGSYDCPEVWTLRRFRDYSLAMTWYGRLFIAIYYAISPTIVKWFGHTLWFNRMWKGKLDRMVERLKSEGYEDTPYDDKNW